MDLYAERPFLDHEYTARNNNDAEDSEIGRPSFERFGNDVLTDSGNATSRSSKHSVPCDESILQSTA